MKALVCYAMKANSNQAVIKTLADLGAGADVVSGGELKRARAAGIAPAKIMFSGIGKTAGELALAVDEGILCVNVESEAGARAVVVDRRGQGPHARDISVRVNPDVDAKTHAKIATGKAENKFGIPISRARARLCPGREAPRHRSHRRRHAYRQPDHRACAVRRCVRAAGRFRADACAADGHAISHIDLGGGLGIPYREDNEPPPHPDAYAAHGQAATRDLGCTLVFEPGRLIVGNAGILVTRVLYVKRGEAQDLRHRRCGDERSHPARRSMTPTTTSVRYAEPTAGAARIVADVVGAGLRIRRFPGARPGHGRPPSPATSSRS